MNVTGVIRRRAPWRRSAAPTANELRLASQGPDPEFTFKIHDLTPPPPRVSWYKKHHADRTISPVAGARPRACRFRHRAVGAAAGASPGRHAGGRTRVSRRSQPRAPSPGERVEPRRLDAGHVHHRGYRADRRRGERRARERRDPLCDGGAPLRRRDAAAGGAPPARRAEELADDVGAAGSEGGRGAHPPGRLDGGRVRERQVLPEGRDRRGVPRHRGDHPVPGGQPGPEAAAGGLGRVAHDRRADEEGLRALRRAVEQGREGAGVSGHRRDVARQVRHAARRVREGARPAVGTAAAALSLAARVRAQPAAREVRRRRAREGPDARAPARQPVAAGLGERLRRLSRRRATRRAPR